MPDDTNGVDDVFVATQVSAGQRIAGLIATVQGLALPKGTETGLVAPLQTARKVLLDASPANEVAACRALAAFGREVAAQQRAGTLTSAQAATLTEAAQAILAAQGAGKESNERGAGCGIDSAGADSRPRAERDKVRADRENRIDWRADWPLRVALGLSLDAPLVLLAFAELTALSAAGATRRQRRDTFHFGPHSRGRRPGPCRAPAVRAA